MFSCSLASAAATTPRFSTLADSSARLSRTNPVTSSRVSASWCSAVPSRSRSPASCPDTRARSPVKVRTVSSRSASSVVSACRLRTVPNSSSRLAASVCVSSDTSVMAAPAAAPLPSRLSAATATRSDSAPSLFAPSGPRASASSTRLPNTSSSSTGTWPRASGIVPPSSSVGPPEYTGASCTYRSAMSVGLTSTACASAGIFWSRS
jgi:hypothetical protein